MKKGENEKQDVFKEALFYFQIGHFQEVVRLCQKLRMRGVIKDDPAFLQLEWLALVYLGSANSPSLQQTEVARKILSSLPGGGGAGLPEYALALLERGQRSIDPIDVTLDVALAQHGVVSTYHPSALLRLAIIASESFNDTIRAGMLLNCCLGFRGVFVSLADVENLAVLLVSLEAPFSIWADWCAIFVRHLKFATVRQKFIKTETGDPKAIAWAVSENARSEQVLEKILSVAPVGTLQLLKQLAKHTDAEPLAEVIESKFSLKIGTPTSTQPNKLWFDPNVLRLRYFWHDMLPESEQHFLRNGDWALFYGPTPDASMGVAQWWRAVEAVLKRAIAMPLADHYSRNPEWAEWDRENLTSKEQEKEKIFLTYLTDTARTEKITLGDLVLLLAKLTAEPGKKIYRSRLRKEAVSFFRQSSRQLEPLMNSSWLDPPHLTQENVSYFRNRSSHDSSVGIIDASVGRYLSKRIFDLFYDAVLDSWGFAPSIADPEYS